jgi:hypothetical protein
MINNTRGFMTRRINITPSAGPNSVKGNRRGLISDAVPRYVSSRGDGNLAARLKSGYLANARRDLEIAQEWFPLEEEACQRTATPAQSAKSSFSLRRRHHSDQLRVDYRS